MTQAITVKKNLILLVEDNPTDELLTIEALEEHHMPVDIVVARNGAEALDYIFGKGQYAQRNAIELPSFILLDLKLPKVSGLSVLKKIRSDERTRIIPVVILTSSKEEQDMVESYSLGANSYIQKPVNYQEFSKVAEQLGIYWFTLNQLPRSHS
jgi:two-component system, response regulator